MGRVALGASSGIKKDDAKSDYKCRVGASLLAEKKRKKTKYIK